MTESKNLRAWTAQEKWLNYHENTITQTLAAIYGAFVVLSSIPLFRYTLYRLACSEAYFGATCRLRCMVKR